MHKYVKLKYEIIIEAKKINNFGRNIGYSLDSERKASYSFDGNGRMSGMNIGENKDFSFGYLPNTYIQNTINYPNGLVKTVNFETNRNLISSVEHGFTDSIISKYSYTNDLLGRRTGKVQHFDNTVKNFDFDYNPRSEVISANQLGDTNYQYSFNYDNIGNRISALESGINKRYITNELNQYITNAGFVPMYDLDGNGIKIKTSTGEWSVEYNGENRPIKFTQGDTVITMNYDYMGRRFEKIMLNNQDVKSSQRFVYNGYLQIEELTANNETVKSYIWDPTETSATKPMVIKTTTDTAYYLHDGNKNVVDILSATNSAFAHYEYSPFGAVTTSSGDLASQNNFTFSSEYIDDELGLVYYNYRHYNPHDGRWISRDPIEYLDGYNFYAFIKNTFLNAIDYIGFLSYPFGTNDCTRTEHLPDEGVGMECGVREEVYNCRTTKSNGKVLGTNGCSFPKDLYVLLPAGSLTYLLNEVCNEHDRCYNKCGSIRADCDKKLEEDALKIAKDAGVVDHFLTKIMTYIVDEFGETNFEKAQDDACVWEKRSVLIQCNIPAIEVNPWGGW